MSCWACLTPDPVPRASTLLGPTHLPSCSHCQGSCQTFSRFPVISASSSPSLPHLACSHASIQPLLDNLPPIHQLSNCPSADPGSLTGTPIKASLHAPAPCLPHSRFPLLWADTHCLPNSFTCLLTATSAWSSRSHPEYLTLPTSCPCCSLIWKCEEREVGDSAARPPPSEKSVGHYLRGPSGNP